MRQKICNNQSQKYAKLMKEYNDLKNSDIYKTDLRQYISRMMDLEFMLKLVKG